MGEERTLSERPLRLALILIVVVVAIVGWMEYRRRTTGADADRQSAGTNSDGTGSHSTALTGRLLAREGGPPSEGALVLLVDGAGARVLDADQSDRFGSFELLRPAGLTPPPSLWVIFPDGQALHRTALPTTSSFPEPLFPQRAPLTALFRTEGLQNRLWEIRAFRVDLALPAIPRGLRAITARSPSTGVLLVPAGVPLDVRLWLAEDEMAVAIANVNVPVSGDLLDGLLPVAAPNDGRWAPPFGPRSTRQLLVFAPGLPDGVMVTAQQGTERGKSGMTKIGFVLKDGMALLDDLKSGSWTIYDEAPHFDPPSYGLRAEVNLDRPGIHLVKLRQR